MQEAANLVTSLQRFVFCYPCFPHAVSWQRCFDTVTGYCFFCDDDHDDSVFYCKHARHGPPEGDAEGHLVSAECLHFAERAGVCNGSVQMNLHELPNNTEACLGIRVWHAIPAVTEPRRRKLFRSIIWSSVVWDCSTGRHVAQYLERS